MGLCFLSFFGFLLPQRQPHAPKPSLDDDEPTLSILGRLESLLRTLPSSKARPSSLEASDGNSSTHSPSSLDPGGPCLCPSGPYWLTRASLLAPSSGLRPCFGDLDNLCAAVRAAAVVPMPSSVALSFSSEDFFDSLRLPLDLRERLEPLTSPKAMPDSEEEAEPLLKVKNPPFFSFFLCCSFRLSW